MDIEQTFDSKPCEDRGRLFFSMQAGIVTMMGLFLVVAWTNQSINTMGDKCMKDQARDEFIELLWGHRPSLLLGGPDFLKTFSEDPGDDPDGDEELDDPEDKGKDKDDDPGDEDPGDELDIEYSRGLVDQIMQAAEIDFSKLLKDNPKLKKAYTERFNRNMSKRLEKYADVDVEEYRDLKKRADAGNLEGDAKVWKDKYDKLLSQHAETSKQTAIQQVAIEEGLDSEQIAFVTSMIKLDKLEQDDEGDWMGIEDEIERIREKFPRMFDVKQKDGDDEDPSEKKKKKYNPGNKKHNGGGGGGDRKEAGRQRALERHKRK